MPALTPAVRLFRQLTSVPTAPFYEHGVLARARSWLQTRCPGRATISRSRAGMLVRYQGAGPGPSIVLAAHTDHPGFHIERSNARGARARLQGGLLREMLPGAVIEAFSARPAGNEPLARGVLGPQNGGTFPVRWTAPPRGASPAFAVLALPPFAIEGSWLMSRSIDDVLGCAVSLEALRRVALAGMKTNVTVALNRAEEVGFVGALEMARVGALAAGDSIVSVETSRAMAGARPGRGPVVRLGDKASLFDPNLLGLLDQAAGVLKARGRPCQRVRLTGGTCEATAYVAFGYESAGVAIPLVNYHNGGRDGVAPEKVRLEDVEGAVQLLVEASRLFPEAPLRGRQRGRLERLHARLSPLL